MALGLVLVAEEEGPGGGVLFIHLVEACGEAVVAVLDLDFLGVDMERVVEGDVGGLIVDEEEGGVEGIGEEPGFEASDAEDVVLRQRDAFDGEEFL